MTAADYKNRIDRVRFSMKENRIDGLIVTDPLSIWYLTGIYLESGERLFALYLNCEEEKIFVNRMFTLPEVSFSKVEFSDGQSPAEVLSSEIIKSGILGVDRIFEAGILLPLMELLPEVKFVNGSRIVDLQRAVKDSEEIELMKEVSLINDRCMEKAIDFIHEGVTEIQVAEYIDSLFKAEGCENSFPTIVSFGKNAAEPHHVPDETSVIKGDCILIDMGCRKNRYCSDMTRTLFFGTTPQEVAKVHDLVRRANEKAIAAIKPGVKLSEIDAVARNLISEAGYGECFNHRLGHFIGQTDHEWGELSPSSDLTAVPGMIFSVEPGIYVKDKFGVRIEDLVLVTQDGAVPLNSVDKHWHII